MTDSAKAPRWNGRTYSELTNVERAALHKEDAPLFDAMRAFQQDPPEPEPPPPQVDYPPLTEEDLARSDIETCYQWRDQFDFDSALSRPFDCYIPSSSAAWAEALFAEVKRLRALHERTQMRWTSDRPKVPGHYWRRSKSRSWMEVSMVDVGYHGRWRDGVQEDKDLHVGRPSSDGPSEVNAYCDYFGDLEWCGPISEPAEDSQDRPGYPALAEFVTSIVVMLARMAETGEIQRYALPSPEPSTRRGWKNVWASGCFEDDVWAEFCEVEGVHIVWELNEGGQGGVTVACGAEKTLDEAHAKASDAARLVGVMDALGGTFRERSTGKLKWTDEPPLRPGFYWARTRAGSGPSGQVIESVVETVHVYEVEYGGQKSLIMESYGDGGGGGFDMEQVEAWAGPLAKPEE